MSTCPAPVELQQLARGLVDGASAAVLRRHLDSCERCRAIYASSATLKPVSGGADTTSPVAASAHTLIAGTSPSAVMARHLPQIEGFQIVGLLGKGGMGIVYRAVQTSLGRTVALKVLPAMVGAASPEAVARFKREATAAARLHHTNIIPIYLFGESRDSYYCAMEVIEGKPLDVVIRRLGEADAPHASPASLTALLQDILTDAGVSPAPGSSADGSRDAGSRASTSSSGRGRMYYQQVARWMADAADALDYAHKEGIIHRDIKPGNLILSVDGRIMVADFGLARGTDEKSVTLTGRLLGTLRYMSPEQAMAKRVRVDHRTDVYSLGATMYELLTFRPAFTGDDDKEIFGKIIARDPDAPRKINAGIPRELETICLKTLEKDPHARYATARALAEDLRRFINDLPIEAKPPGVPTRTIKFVRRHRALTIAVVAIALLGASTTWFVRQNKAARIEKLVAEATVFSEQHKWAEAVGRYEQALDLDPTYLKAGGNLVRAYKDWYNDDPQHDPQLLEHASQSCERMLAAHPDHTGLLNLKAVILKMQGRLEEAVGVLKTLTELDPQAYANWTNLGTYHALMKDLDSAGSELARAVELVAGYEMPPVDPLRNLASLELLLGRAVAAERIERAMAGREPDATSLIIRARIRLAAQDAQAWRAAFDDAITADALGGEQDPRIRRIRALAELRNGNNDQAIHYAALAIAEGDMPPVNRLIAGIAHASMGKLDTAREQLRLAEAARPAELQEPGGFIVTADKGVLWFESSAELDALTAEAHERLAQQSPPPGS